MSAINASPVYGRAFAVTYMLAYLALALGVVSAIVTHGSVWSILVAVTAAAVLVVLANVLARVDPDLDTGPRRFGQFSGYQLGWYNLVFGAELGRAWRAMRTGPSRRVTAPRKTGRLRRKRRA